MRYISKRGQLSSEYVIILGMVFVVLTPILYYALIESNTSIKLNQIDDSINTLVRAVDTVYSIGPGTKKYVWINTPTNIINYSLENKAISLKLLMYGKVSDVFGKTKADLAGEIPLLKGQHRVVVEMLESGYVQFGEANDTVAPSVIWTSPKGTINYNGIVLRATTDEYSVCKYDESNVDYSSMENVFVGSALTHERDIGVLDNGTYVYYARCQDPSGNIMQESAIINFTIVPTSEHGVSNGSLPGTNETYEPYSPTIELIYPENNYTDQDGLMLFQYNVTDVSLIWYCILAVDNMTEATSFWVTRDIVQNFTVGGIEFGNHSWNISCSDVHGNTNTSETRKFTMNFTQDNDVPVVNLVGPPDNSTRGYWLTTFSYNVSDVTSGIDYCELNINGLIGENSSVGWTIKDTPVQEDTTEEITLPLFKANYTWNVSCVDNSHNANQGNSDTWYLVLNISAGEEAFIDSCAGYCGYNGYVDGICRQNSQKCREYTGGTWESGGDKYCPTQTGDFCCCTQQQIS